MFSTLVVVILSKEYAYAQTYQDIHIKCMQFFVYQKYLNKL